MIEFRVSMPELNNLIAWCEQFPGMAELEVYGAMEQAALIAEGEIARRTPVDTGNLRNRITSRVESAGFEVRGIVEIANVPYAPWVEEDTRPHVIEARNARALRFQPSSPVAFRIGSRRAQFRVQRGNRAGRLTSRLGDTTAVFARRVQHPGTTGAHMFRDGAQAAFPRIQRLFASTLRRLVREQRNLQKGL